MEHSQDENKIERQTYSFLEWLGEIGGLFEICRMCGILLVRPCASYNRKSELLTKIFRFIPSFNNSKKTEDSKIIKLEEST